MKRKIHDEGGKKGRLLLVLTAIMMLACMPMSGQQVIIIGKVMDSLNGTPLPYANILVDGTAGFTADGDGHYRISTTTGTRTLQVSHIGYHSLTLHRTFQTGTTTLDLPLAPRIVALSEAVVTAGRHLQQISHTTVSMQVIKPDFLESNQTYDLEQALEKIPGVDVIDGQANIRGGSGWSYGAGSRVLVLVDDLPLLAPDAADAKWNFLPLENIGRVEIIKGASSALYGSSALNGVINILTAWPSGQPETRINLTGGIWMHPRRKELLWDDNRQPLFGNLSLLHTERHGPLDLVLSANAFNDPGYRKDNFQSRIRVNTKLRYHDRKTEGLTYGLQASLMQADLIDFLLWKDADSGGWTQNPAAVTHNQGYRLYVDPFLSFHSPGGFRHQLKTRYFRTYNNFPQDPEKDNEATQLFADYQLHKRLDPGVELTAGFAASTARSEASLFGDHRFRNLALFAQADKAFGLLTLSLGARWEYFRLDDVKESRPVVRAGVNYRAWDYTFLRASFGQGYRFPSIAEKFTTTSVGGVNVFPNPYLGSETGWSAEAGLRQGYHLGGLQGYLDVALFWTEYQEMMEFSFGFYDTITFLPTTEYLSLDNMGFQSQNIGRARIAGLEMVITGQGRIGRFPLTFMLGYTYTDPVDENSDSAYRAGKSVEDDILKYRYRHSFQADVMMGYGRLSLGMGWVWHSYLECVDQIFVDPVLGQLILPGYREYRNLHDGEAYSQVDVRAGFQLSPSLNVAVMSRNLFNRENIGRPGDLRPPRSLLLTLRLRL